MSVKFTFNGRQVRPENIGREFRQAVEAGVGELVEARIRRAQRRRCPEHGTMPGIHVAAGKIVVNACCERFRDEIGAEIVR